MTGARPRAIASKAPLRLTKRSQFLHVAKGVRRHCATFTLQSAPRSATKSEAITAQSETGPRFGLTVTRKIGTAVVRNKIKRRLREALRLSDHGGHENFDYVIVARLPALTCDFTHLRQDLQRTIKQLHEKPHQKTAKTQTNTALVNSGSANSGAANFDLTHANRRKAAQPSLELKRSGPQS